MLPSVTGEGAAVYMPKALPPSARRLQPLCQASPTAAGWAVAPAGPRKHLVAAQERKWDHRKQAVGGVCRGGMCS